jgi:hypothetical protein
MSLPGFIKHLGILEVSRLIERRWGRATTSANRKSPWTSAWAAAIAHQEGWNGCLDRLGRFLSR